MKKTLLTLFIGVYLLCGCAKKLTEEQQMRNSFISGSAAAGAYSGDKSVMTYIELKHQIASSSDGLSFRIQDDSQQQYLMLTLSEQPKSVGQRITIKVESLGVEGIQSRNYEVELQKSDLRSLWFWSKTDLVGFVIPVFTD